MNTATIHIRTDKQLKDKTDIIFKELGLNTSSAINIFLRAVANNNGIPFELKTKQPNKETIEAMLELNENRGKRKLKTFSSVNELMKDLNS